MIEATPNDSLSRANLWCELQAPDGTGLMEPPTTLLCYAKTLGCFACIKDENFLISSLARLPRGPLRQKLARIFCRFLFHSGTPLSCCHPDDASHILSYYTDNVGILIIQYLSVISLSGIYDKVSMVAKIIGNQQCIRQINTFFIRQ